MLVPQYDWVVYSLESSMLMLYYACNGEDIPIERLQQYISSWLRAENITYIVGNIDGDSTSFKLAVCYPAICICNRWVSCAIWEK